VKQKQVGPARTPAPAKLPEPPPTKTAAIYFLWQTSQSKHQGAIDAFRGKINKPTASGDLPSVLHAIEWEGGRAMHAEAFLEETQWAVKFLEPLGSVKALPDDLQTLAKVQEVLESVEARIRAELLGSTVLTYGPTGPWAQFSTNPLASFAAIVRCNAKREVYAMVQTMLRLLDGE